MRSDHIIIQQDYQIIIRNLPSSFNVGIHVGQGMVGEIVGNIAVVGVYVRSATHEPLTRDDGY